jgi:ribosomal protein L3 glutamine methyltransferase
MTTLQVNQSNQQNAENYTNYKNYSPDFSGIRLLDAKRFAYKQLKQAFWAGQICYGHGFLDALEEAHEITLSAAGLNYQDVESMPEFWQTQLTDQEFKWLNQALSQRITHQKPLAYLTQRAYLHGLEFYIDERALIPRSFIAELLQNRAFDDFLEASFNAKTINNFHLQSDFGASADLFLQNQTEKEMDDSFKILELCTGSGCLAILAAAVFEEAEIQAIDISTDALAVAKINHEKYRVLDAELANRIDFYQSDLYQNVQGQFDIIITNPPYVCEKSMSILPKEYQHEPVLALAGGDDGMDIVEKIIKEAKKHLKPTGFLVVEIGNEYEHTLNLFNRLGLLNAVWLEVSAGMTQVFLIHASDLAKI